MYKGFKFYLFHVDFKGANRLTLWAGAGLHLLVLGLEEGPQDEAALATVVLDHAELRQDPCAARHYTAGSDQLVQVQLPKERREDTGRLQGRQKDLPQPPCSMHSWYDTQWGTLISEFILTGL